MEWLKNNFPGAHSTITSLTDKVTKPLQTALPSVATDSGTQNLTGMPSEPSGYTATGGRKRRTRGRKNRKTRRRKH